MIKLFFLIFTYVLMIVQLISVLSLDVSKSSPDSQTQMAIHLMFLIVLIGIVYVLSKKLIKEMLTEK